MDKYVMGFVPPLVGLDGEFNTIRLGLAYKKRLCVGETVFLLNEKARQVFGEATVVSVESANLAEICLMHAESNHMELGQTDGQQSIRLFAYLQKIYGPHIATPSRMATVIYLRRLHDPKDRRAGDGSTVGSTQIPPGPESDGRASGMAS